MLALAAVHGFGCAPSESERVEPALSEPVSSPSSACLEALASDASQHGWPGDSVIILQCNEEQCGGADQPTTLALVEANGHRVRRVLDGLSMLLIDVESPDDVFEWVCRYGEEPAFRTAFAGAWFNLATGEH